MLPATFAAMRPSRLHSQTALWRYYSQPCCHESLQPSCPSCHALWLRAVFAAAGKLASAAVLSSAAMHSCCLCSHAAAVCNRVAGSCAIAAVADGGMTTAWADQSPELDQVSLLFGLGAFLFYLVFLSFLAFLSSLVFWLLCFCFLCLPWLSWLSCLSACFLFGFIGFLASRLFGLP